MYTIQPEKLTPHGYEPLGFLSKQINVKGKGSFFMETSGLRLLDKKVSFSSIAACLYWSIAFSSVKYSRFWINDWGTSNASLTTSELMRQRILDLFDSIIRRSAWE